jgi:hypothetical protein
MATGQDLINAACSFLGQRYSTAPGRDDPLSDHKDCSGLIAASYLVATGQPLGANVSVTIYDLAVRNGLAISREQALVTAGACLLIPDDPYRGWGPNGHIGFSDGAGGTVEATPPRVQRLDATYQPWGPAACLLPGIDYDGSTESEEDEVLYITKQSDPSVGIWAADGTWKRHIRIDEWNFIAYVSPDKAQVVEVSDDWWDSLPVAGAVNAAGPEASTEAIRKVVREELNRTKLAG